MARISGTRLRAAAGAALLTLSLASPALADRDDHRGYRMHRHDRSCDRDGWRHDRRDYDRRDHGYWQRGQRGYSYWDRWTRGDYRRHRDERWGCRPCRTHWRSERDFHRHLHGRHGMPYQAIPGALVVANWGWMFGG